MGKGWYIGAVAATVMTLLVSSRDAGAGRWAEEDFAGRVPTNYPFTNRDQSTLVGALETYVVQEADTMLDIGRHFDVGYNEMIAANPGVDPWVPPPGEVLLVPTEYVLPESGYQGLVVNIPEMRLYYFHGGGRGAEGTLVTTYPVGLGRDDWRTPQGSFRVRGKTENPTWVIPESIRAEHIRERGDDRAMIAGGDPDNPLGLYRLELTLPLYALHGSNMPWGVGMQVSHGCIRLYNEDIAALFREVRVGTPGEFVYQPVKIGIRSGVVYVEVHEDIYGLRTSLEDEAERLLSRHGWTDRIDRARLRQALVDRSGIPVAIERDRTVETAAN
jgi:L,D-transpeptidase ErfK/SrfK